MKLFELKGNMQIKKAGKISFWFSLLYAALTYPLLIFSAIAIYASGGVNIQLPLISILLEIAIILSCFHYLMIGIQSVRYNRRAILGWIGCFINAGSLIFNALILGMVMLRGF